MAGTSFLTPGDAGKLRFGNKIVNLVADRTQPGGLATTGYDDEGVKADRWHLVREGMFVDWQTTRELAPLVLRDALAALHQVVLSDLAYRPRDRPVDVQHLEQRLFPVGNGIYLEPFAFHNQTKSLASRPVIFDDKRSGKHLKNCVAS